MHKNSTCNRCTSCGKTDLKVELQVVLYKSMDCPDKILALIKCTECIEKKTSVQKYGYTLNVWAPEDKTLKFVLEEKAIDGENKTKEKNKK